MAIHSERVRFKAMWSYSGLIHAAKETRHDWNIDEWRRTDKEIRSPDTERAPKQSARLPKVLKSATAAARARYSEQ